MDEEGHSSSRIAELRVSARGWHGVHLAVLGFIGLCGVLQPGAGSGEPHWLQVLAGLLVVAALGIACVATVLVALAAEVTTRAGQVCGGLGSPSQQGVLAVSAGGRVVEVALSDVVSLKPVDAC